jgi:hypothetical protein
VIRKSTKVWITLLYLRKSPKPQNKCISKLPNSSTKHRSMKPYLSHKMHLFSFKRFTRAPYPALLLLGQIHLARAEVDLSREHYLKATEIDPEGQKTGAAPFLWSAQLSEEGGAESIRWFEKACMILRRELKDLEAKTGQDEAEDEVSETRRQLGETLCSMTEVYMTDLS